MGKGSRVQLRNRAPLQERKIVSEQHTQSLEVHIGPLPPYADLQGYENIAPGTADRIISMAEKEAEHRHNMEEKKVNAVVMTTRLGQVFGFIIALAGFAAGTYLVDKGHDIAGGGLIGVTVVSLVSVFVAGVKGKNKVPEAGPEPPAPTED